MKKVSVGQILCEFFCQENIDDSDEKKYSDIGYMWNSLTFETRSYIMNSVKEYLIEQLGEEMVEK